MSFSQDYSQGNDYKEVTKSQSAQSSSSQPSISQVYNKIKSTEKTIPPTAPSPIRPSSSKTHSHGLPMHNKHRLCEFENASMYVRYDEESNSFVPFPGDSETKEKTTIITESGETVVVSEGDFVERSDGTVVLISQITTSEQEIWFCNCTTHDHGEIRILAKWDQLKLRWFPKFDSGYGGGRLRQKNKVVRVIQVDFNMHSIVQFDINVGDAWESEKTRDQFTNKATLHAKQNSAILKSFQRTPLPFNGISMTTTTTTTTTLLLLLSSPRSV